jgi:putative ABC transport system permease protein
MLSDLRFALRMLAKSPGFTAIAILTLALGIGANSAIFSVVNSVLLQRLGYKNPEELVWIWATRKNVARAFYSIPNLKETQAQCGAIANWIAFSNWGANLRGTNETERVQGIKLSAEGLQELGVQAEIGRTLTAQDDELNADNAVMLSHGLWQRRFGGDPRVVGSTQVLNGESYTVIGVLPRHVVIPNAEADVIAPLRLDVDPRRGERGTNFLRVIARLKPGVSAQQAQVELAAITDRLRTQFPEDNGNLTAPRVLRLQDELAGEYRQVLWVLLSAVVVVLLIACSNLANLQLARTSSRHREMAIRSALGATRGQLLRQLLTEGILLAAIGASLGLLIASWGKDILIAFAPTDFPRAAAVTIDARVLLFCLTISLFAGVVIGLVPALRATRTDLTSDLKDGNHAAIGDTLRTRARNGLIVAEVALSLVLLVCAGLLLKSFNRLQAVNPGFAIERGLAVRLALPPTKYSDGPAIKTFYDRLALRLQAIPGVDSLGAVSALPMSALNARTEFVISGRPPPKPSDVPGAQHRWVSPGYFHAMGIQLIRGREFAEQDNKQGAGVVVIDQALARHFFSGEDPIGAHIQITLGDGITGRDFEIVGVCDSVKHNTLNEEPIPTFYGPLPQVPKSVAGFVANNFSLIVRNRINAQVLSESIRRELRLIDADVAVSSVKPIEQLVAASVAPRRFNLIMLATFSGTALLLAASGIYAVIAYLVSERTREIGVRLALGARRGDVLALIVGYAFRLVATGVILGLAGAVVATRAISALLYSTSTIDLFTYGIVAALLIFVALLASYIPALRATRVDPIVALRTE